MQRSKNKNFRHLIPVFLVLIYLTYTAFTVLGKHDPKADKKRKPNVAVVVHEPEIKAEAEKIHEEGEHAVEKLKPGKLIIDHIADAHDWHIATIGHSHISVPLPIIIYDNTGLHVFSSSRFEHGHAHYKGYALEDNKIVAVNEEGAVNHKADFYDLSITKNVAAMFIAVALLLWIMLSVAARYRKNALTAPKGMQSLVEPLIVFLRDEVAKPSIGPKYERFFPYLLTIFFFIFILNLFGLIPFFPGGANVTGNIAVTMVMALFTFAITSYNGNKAYWGHIFYPPGVPLWLLPLMVPIEIIGMFNKPIVLMIRLFANIMAGHIVILGFFSLIFIFGEMNAGLGMGVSALSVAFSIFMYMLELLVAFLQAYVFTLLSSLYFGMAVEEHHHKEEHH